MVSKEQYFEHWSFEDPAYLPLVEKISRRKPQWDEEETRIYSPPPVARLGRMPFLPTSKAVLEWPGFRKLVEDWHEPIQKPILQMFIANNGPMAVARSIKEELGFIRNGDKVPDDITPYILIRAFGITFERLACYWLKITTEGQRHVIDVGSTQRVARAFKRASGIHIMPDGLIINNNYNPSLLEAACEYKTNPTDPKALESLNRQLTELVDFFTKLGNKTLYARGRDKFDLDRRAHWEVREIRIAARPSIMLVIPQDRDYEGPNEFVEVRKTPFSSRQLSRIVHTLMDDIHGMGFIEQELALLKERRQVDISS